MIEKTEGEILQTLGSNKHAGNLDCARTATLLLSSPLMVVACSSFAALASARRRAAYLMRESEKGRKAERQKGRKAERGGKERGRAQGVNGQTWHPDLGCNTCVGRARVQLVHVLVGVLGGGGRYAPSL